MKFQPLEKCGLIAQSVEQMAFNHWVEGSSPSQITIKFNSLGHLLKMPFSCFVFLLSVNIKKLHVFLRHEADLKEN